MDIKQQYEPLGLNVWYIADTSSGQETLPQVEAFAVQYGLGDPVLIDVGGNVHNQYGQQTAQGSIYPQQWLIGADGTVVYVNNTYDPDALVPLIEAELGL